MNIFRCECVLWFQVVQNQNTLVKIQPSMKTDLLSAVRSFQSEAQSFYVDYDHRCSSVRARQV